MTIIHRTAWPKNNKACNRIPQRFQPFFCLAFPVVYLAVFCYRRYLDSTIEFLLLSLKYLTRKVCCIRFHFFLSFWLVVWDAHEFMLITYRPFFSKKTFTFYFISGYEESTSEQGIFSPEIQNRILRKVFLFCWLSTPQYEIESWSN